MEPLRLAYVMSRFPKLTETFVLNEIRAMSSAGERVDVYPLLRARQPVAHPEARRWEKRAHFHQFVSLSIVRANLHYLRTRPLTYLRTWGEVLRGTWGSLNFLIGAVAIFPKVTRFAFEMERRATDHLHAHFATHPAVAALIVHRLTGIPFSFTAHGSDLHVDRRMLGRKAEAAEFVVTVSHYNRQLILSDCGEHLASKVHVVHCGADLSLFSPGLLSRPAEDGPFRIACVASFEEVKGHRFLLEACRILEDRGVVIDCRLVGDGPLGREVERRIARLGLGDRVSMLGPRPREDVARLLRESDVAALASYRTAAGKREGIPVALMEAMASGLPVVASRISGIPELVDDGLTGILVQPRASAELAAALEKLARDPELRRRMGIAARRKVEREFNVEDGALRLRRLIRGSRRGLGSASSPASGRDGFSTLAADPGGRGITPLARSS